MNDLTTLPGLAERINQEHAEAETSMRRGLLHARNVGELLIQAKSKALHGGWLPWLAANLRFPERTARRRRRFRRCPRS